ncbi:hypothetical protein FAI41_01170 [Acetobacteraceae bacterium]|nr:hypothetical protein FAI41_01170 [Acetobacteraceae bacterium]
MKETLKNVIFENELAEFYLNSITDRQSVTGQITITKNGEITAILTDLPLFFQKALQSAQEISGKLRKLPQIWGKILKTGQPFYLYHPALLSTSEDLEANDGLGDFDVFWQILEIDAAVFFDYAKKKTHYLLGYAPPSLPYDLNITSFIWDLDDFRAWLGAFVRCRYQPDLTLQKDLKETAGDRISLIADGELAFVPYEFKSEIKEYRTALGKIKVSRNCTLGETSLFQTEGRIKTSGFLQITPHRNYNVQEAGTLYSGIESFFRTFVSRDQQIPYPELRLSNGLHARLIVPRMAIRPQKTQSPSIYKNIFPFNQMKAEFGDYLTHYLEKSKIIQSGYSVYVKDAYSLEKNEAAFFFLAASLEHLVNLLLHENFTTASVLLSAMEKIIASLEEDIESLKNSHTDMALKNSLRDSKGNLEHIKKQILSNENASLEKSLQRLYFKNRLWLAIQFLECDFSWKEIRNFTNEFTSLRNYLAHQASIFEIGKGTSAAMRLLPILSATRMLTCAIIMKSVGFKKEMITAALQSGEFTPERSAITPSCSFAELFRFDR